MFERFTDRTRKIMALANCGAHRNGMRIIGDLEVLLGLLEERRGNAAEVLRRLGVDIDRTYGELIGKRSMLGLFRPMELFPQTPQAKKMIETAMKVSDELGHGHVGSEHFLLAMTMNPNSAAGRALLERKITEARVREALAEVMAGHR